MCAAQTVDSDFAYKYIFFFYFATITVGRSGLKTACILCGVSLVGLGPSIGCVVTLAAIVNSLVSSRRAFRWSSVFHAHDNGKSAHSLDFYDSSTAHIGQTDDSEELAVKSSFQCFKCFLISVRHRPCFWEEQTGEPYQCGFRLRNRICYINF